eukprot:TRINITY_DN57390_c0_g1_i1.p1 TRINITY_DN57390_c0_g1~~TRINITY_DN57390_c0_g1_i1.p1  ORF type:complete len:196 (+),score=24.78 TRINITY_DN57390_c0_g1_i1:55-642(+)
MMAGNADMEVTPVRKPICRNIEGLTPLVEAGCRRASRTSSGDEKKHNRADTSEMAVLSNLDNKGCSSLLDAMTAEPEPPKPTSALAEASLLVTRAEAGILEFELDGMIYRVNDPAAFGRIVKTSVRPKRRKLADFLRAQKLARQSESVDATNIDVRGEPEKASENSAVAEREGSNISKVSWGAVGPSLASELGIC